MQTVPGLVLYEKSEDTLIVFQQDAAGAHKGRSSHVWNVDVFTSTAKLVSSVRVVNSILKKG